MSVVVSDTSPIRCLSHLQLLELLPRLFGKVVIPSAVNQELLVPGRGVAPLNAAELPGVTIRDPLDANLVQSLSSRLHPGEAQALALAVEVGPDFVLIDEKTGRSIARELGLVPLGVLGALVKAKRAGLLSAVAPLIATLRLELDFRVSQDVEGRILALAGEAAGREP